MPIRIYIAPQIGSGMMLSPNPATWNDTTGPWRSPLNNFIDTAADWPALAAILEEII